jgi:hypothetical protein
MMQDVSPRNKWQHGDRFSGVMSNGNGCINSGKKLGPELRAFIEKEQVSIG